MRRTSRQRPREGAGSVEPLESRVMLTTFTFNGTAGGDTFVVRDASVGAAARVGVKINGGVETVQVVGGGDSVVLNGLGGANTFEVVGTVAGVLLALNGGASADTFNVTAAGVNANTLKGAVNITGGAGADTLFYDDNYFNPAVGPTIDVSPFSIDRVVASTAAGPVNYIQVETVRIDMNDGAGLLRVFGTAPGVTTYVFAGDGDDTMDLYPRQVSILGPGLGPPSLEGALNWSGEVGAGDRVRVLDADGQTPFNYHFHTDTTSQVLDGLGASLHVGDNEELVLDAGAADDTFVIGDGTQAGEIFGEVTVNAGGGSDVLEYRDEDTFRGGNPGETYTIGPAGFEHVVDDVGSYTQAVVHSAAVESLRIAASENDTNFLVTGTGAVMTLEGGGGDDNYTVGSTSLEGVVDLVTADGGAGFNTLTLVDTGDPTADVVHVDAVRVGAGAGDTLFPPGGGVIDVGMYAVTIDLPDAATGDTVYIVPRQNVTINVNGGLPGANPNGDTLVLALAGVSSPVHTPSSATSGRYAFGNRAPVFYTSIENRTIDAAAPAVVGATYRFDLPIPALDVRFTEDIGQSLDVHEPQFSFTDTGGVFPTVGLTMTYDPGTFTARFEFGDFPGGVLPDGNYSVVIGSGAVQDVAGNKSALWGQVFFALAGDVNHDRRVDFDDLVPLAQNYGGTGKTFVEGDYNYDTRVDFYDLVIFAQRYNTTLAPPVNSLPFDGAVGAGVFEDDRGRFSLRVGGVPSRNRAAYDPGRRVGL